MNKTKDSKGVIRKLDNLGRITLVKEYRDALQIKEGDEIEELLVGNEIIIRKVKKGCMICNTELNHDNAININDKLICKNCIKKMQIKQ